MLLVTSPGMDAALQQRRDLGAVHRLGAARSHETHDEIQSHELLLLQPEGLARDATNPISVDGARCEFFRDDQRESREADGIGSAVNAEAGAADGPPRLERFAHIAGGEPLQGTQTVAPTQTARRTRPLARRARMTARPPRVRMRTRKPCVRLRRTTEGW